MWIILGLAGAFVCASIWVCCKAASDADMTAEWNRNWTGQKFDKERKNETD